MRDIKFRAWNRVSNEMVRDFSIHADGRIGMFDPASSTQDEVYVHLIPMQYTGLKDKNGTEIYERDVLFIDIKPKRKTFLIKWDKSYARFEMYQIIKGGLNYHTGIDRLAKRGEVIGNIYENPELIAK